MLYVNGHIIFRLFCRMEMVIVVCCSRLYVGNKKVFFFVVVSVAIVRFSNNKGRDVTLSKFLVGALWTTFVWQQKLGHIGNHA